MKNLHIKLIYIVFLLATLSSCGKSENLADNSPSGTDGGGNDGSGTGGSMARFTISGDHLYTVNNKSMQVYNINNPADPIPGQEINIGQGIETIYPYKDHLFIGSTDGMFIYNNTNPASPVLLSQYRHITSCDPVVVEGNYAYVTLRTASGSNECNRGVNQLDIIDISNLQSPYLVHSVAMRQPYGLGVDSTSLFVCDEGLKVYNITNPKLPVLSKHFKNITSYDVIPKNNLLMMIGSDGLLQYDYTDRDKLVLLSHLRVEK